MATLRSWFDGLVRRRRVERDLADEIAFHLEARAEHWRSQGLSPAEAMRRARLEFGAVERYREEARAARGLRWLDELRGDLRYAARTLRAAPVFTLVAVTMLAIGIGANTAVFSVVEAVMLRMLPVTRPHELRELAWIEPRDRGWRLSYDGSMRPYADGGRIATSFAFPVFEQIRDRSRTFSAVVAFTDMPITLDAGGRSRQASSLLVSGSFLHGIGTTPLLGRGFTSDDDRAGAAVVAVISHRSWQRDLGGDPAVVGRTIRVNRAPAQIVGVLAPSFEGIEPGRAVDLLLPITTAWPIVDGSTAGLADGHLWSFRMLARLRDGVADDAARAETEGLLAQALSPEIAAATASGSPGSSAAA